MPTPDDFIRIITRFEPHLDDEGLQLSLWLVHPFVQNKTTDRIPGVATSRLSYSGGCFTG
jgi:hypothetical protein